MLSMGWKATQLSVTLPISPLLQDKTRVLILNGLTQHWSPSSFRDAAKTLNSQLGDRWVIRDHDMHVEFWFRDMATLAAVAGDPDFQALQAAEGPYASKIH